MSGPEAPMICIEAKIKAARRELSYARHIALRGTSPEQRARGVRNAARFLADLKALGASEEEA